MKMTCQKEIIKKIFGDDPYGWDDYTIMSTEFIDHVGTVLDSYSINKKERVK